MPFTLSHPAAALPFKNLMPQWFSGLVLLAGSIAPDFEYFFAFELSGSHLKDLFLLHLPTTVFLSVIFTYSLPALAYHLPQSLEERFGFLKEIKFHSLLRKRGLVFLLSSLTGIIGHLVLDELFHPTGITFGISDKWLEARILEKSLNLQRFVFIERVLSVVLLLFLVWYTYSSTSRSSTEKTVSSKTKVFFWLITLGCWAGLSIYKISHQWPASINTIAVTITSAFLLSILTVPVFFRIFMNEKFSDNNRGT